MQCVFYEFRLRKNVPCLLEKNVIYDVKTQFDKRYYVHTEFDVTKFAEFNTNRDELIRYSSEFVPINEVYPAVVQAELDYIDKTLPKHFTKTSTSFLTTGTNHSSDELDRFETVIDSLTDVDGEINRENFYRLLDFINYELVFTYCNSTERTFLDTLSASQLTEQPSTVEVPQILRMLKGLFSKGNSAWYTGSFDGYKILNYRNFSGFPGSFPYRVSLTNLEYNVNYITGI